MKYLTLFFTLLLSLGTQANFFDNCDLYPTHNKTSFEKALKNLMSLNYVRHAISSDMDSDVKFCTQALRLGSSQWKDGLYYFQIFVTHSMTGQNIRKYSFLYQDASTQANHNLQTLNWTGIPAAIATSIFQKMIEESSFYSNKKMNDSGITLLSVLDSDEKLNLLLQNSSLYKKGNVNLDSVSVIQLNETYILATWQNTSSNSFGETPQVFAVLFNQINSNEFLISENSFIYSDLVVPMMAAAKSAKPPLMDDTLAEQHLKEISTLTK